MGFLSRVSGQTHHGRATLDSRRWLHKAICPSCPGCPGCPGCFYFNRKNNRLQRNTRTPWQVLEIPRTPWTPWTNGVALRFARLFAPGQGPVQPGHPGHSRLWRSQKAKFGKAGDVGATNDEVVQHAHVDQRQRITQPPRDRLVRS